jgi:hypothetical protein
LSSEGAGEKAVHLNVGLNKKRRVETAMHCTCLKLIVSSIFRAIWINIPVWRPTAASENLKGKRKLVRLGDTKQSGARERKAEPNPISLATRSRASSTRYRDCRLEDINVNETSFD